MLSPLGLGRVHAGALSQIEPEALVVGGIAQKEDSGSAERVSSRQDGVHQSLTNALPLAVGVHPQRPESERRPTVDSGAAAYHVSDYFAVSFGNDRELGDDVTVGPEPLDQNGFGRGGVTGSGKGSGMNGEDTVVVARQFASQKHPYSLPDDLGGRQ
jgi:hypothetical protein